MSKRCRQTQFLSTAGFGNEMKLKSRLPPFSLIRIWCQRAFCLRLRSRLHLSKFWYTRTVRLGTLGCFRFHVWDCPLSTDWKLSMISLAGNTISHWPDWYGDRLFFQIRVRKDSVQINHCHSSENYANFIHIHRVLPTITRIDQWLGGGRDRHTDQNNGSLCVYFIVQIPPFIDWTCSAREECGAMAEITRSLQIDLVLSDAAATSEP